MVATALRTSPRSTEAEDQFDDGLEIDKVFCPSCSTNLVMIDHSKNIKNSISSPKGTAPIAEVPFCFGCKSHVVCNAEQVQTLIQLGASGHTRIAHKGAILVATPSNIKLKRSSKAWSASPKLTEEHELMIEYFQAASTLSTGGEEVEMALIPDDDNFYLTITPSNGKQRDGYTEPHSPLKFLTEQEISPSNACSQPPKNEARLDTVERYEHDDNRETNDSIDEIDILGTHTEDDDIDQLFDSKEAAEGLRTDETIELIHRGEKAASNEECESTRATTSVQVQMGKSAEYGRGLSAPTSSSDGSQSDGSSSEGGYDFYIPEYNVRREIATKTLGAMMLQGYSLKEDICETCEMPLMDFDKKIRCVVCPVLRRRAALEKQNSNQDCGDDSANKSGQQEKKRAASEIQKEAQEAMEKAREVLDKVKATRQENMLDPKPSKSHDTNCHLDRVESVRSYDTAAEVMHQEQWELLRSEGRLAKARRLLKGWKETGNLCAGKECHGFPLITNGSQNECMVCAGTGAGDDGIYSRNEDNSSSKKGFPDPEFHLNRPKASEDPESVLSNSHAAHEVQSEFESKRKLVSKEVGKRLLKGWTLLDKACPYCVMPLMTNKKQMDEICVLCGLVGKKKEVGTKRQDNVDQLARKQAPAQLDNLRPSDVANPPSTSIKTPSRCDPPEEHEGSVTFPLSSPTRRSIVIPDYEKETGEKNRDPQASVGASFTRKDRREPEEQKTSYFKKEEVQDEGGGDEDNLVVRELESPKHTLQRDSGILTLEIPTTFDFGDEESLRDLIEAAKAAPDSEECSLLGVRRPQPSPGMEHAKVPGVHSPASIYSCQLGRRPPITPETAPRPKGSGLICCASKDTISISSFNDNPFSRADKFGGLEDETFLLNGQQNTSPPSSKTHMKTSSKSFWPPRSTRSVGSGTRNDAIALHELSLSFEELKGSDSDVVSLESDVLDALMGRIEDAKHKLQEANGHDDADLRELIDGLAKTAYDMEMIERPKNNK